MSDEGGFGGWVATPFEAFGLTHGVVVLLAIGVCVGCGLLARREARRGGRVFCDGFSGVMAGWTLLASIWWTLPAQWDVGVSLPIHVCDVTGILVPIALWTRARWAVRVAVFWGLGLSTQAFVSPTLGEPPGDLRFWLFWGGHLWIAAGCFVIAGAIDYRPTRRDYWIVTLVSLGALGLLMVINGVLGTNYGYVGRGTPEARTVIDLLGAWPMRVVWLFLIASLAHGVVLLVYPWLPRALGTRGRGRGRDAGMAVEWARDTTGLNAGADVVRAVVAGVRGGAACECPGGGV